MEEVEAFRSQVEMVGMIGTQGAEEIMEKARELSGRLSPGGRKRSVEVTTPKVIEAHSPGEVKMDRAGYFVVVPGKGESKIVLEHYSNKNELLRVIEGKRAEDIYRTVIENGWVDDLGHAAYLGKELARAELSMKLGFRYKQE